MAIGAAAGFIKLRSLPGVPPGAPPADIFVVFGLLPAIIACFAIHRAPHIMLGLFILAASVAAFYQSWIATATLLTLALLAWWRLSLYAQIAHLRAASASPDHLCPSCQYTLAKGQVICPECGTDAPTTRERLRRSFR